MKTFTFDITRRVVVSIDETKFNAEKMAEFNSCISDFGTDEAAYVRHGFHLAMLCADSDVDVGHNQFIEGYGPLLDAGIVANVDPAYDNVDRVFPEGGAA